MGSNSGKKPERRDVPLSAALQAGSLPEDTLEDRETEESCGVADTVGGVTVVLPPVTPAHVHQVQHQLVVPRGVSSSLSHTAQHRGRDLRGSWGGNITESDSQRMGGRLTLHIDQFYCLQGNTHAIVRRAGEKLEISERGEVWGYCDDHLMFWSPGDVVDNCGH